MKLCLKGKVPRLHNHVYCLKLFLICTGRLRKTQNLRFQTFSQTFRNILTSYFYIEPQSDTLIFRYTRHEMQLRLKLSHFDVRRADLTNFLSPLKFQDFPSALRPSSLVLIFMLIRFSHRTISIAMFATHRSLIHT